MDKRRASSRVDQLADVGKRLRRSAETLKQSTDRISAELARAIAENRPRSSRWT